MTEEKGPIPNNFTVEKFFKMLIDLNDPEMIRNAYSFYKNCMRSLENFSKNINYSDNHPTEKFNELLNGKKVRVPIKNESDFEATILKNDEHWFLVVDGAIISKCEKDSATQKELFIRIKNKLNQK